MEITETISDTGSTKRARGRPRSFDRDVVLERAMQLFWQRGYETTSMSELLKATGLTASSLYGVFGDKETLFLEAVKRYWNGPAQRISEILAQEPTAERAVRRVLERAASNGADPSRPSGCMVALATTNRSPASDHVHEVLAGYRARTEERIRERIERGIVEGDVPISTDAAALARYIQTVMHGLSIYARDAATEDQLRETVDIAMRAWPAPAAGVG
jgi:AcrR family transcriptional regulator